MSTRQRVIRRLVLLFMLGVPLIAHAHDQTILGVAKAVTETQLTIETTADGVTKVSVVALVESTKVLRGDEVVKASDIKVGERVAVTVSTHDDVVTAHEVRLARAGDDAR